MVAAWSAGVWEKIKLYRVEKHEKMKENRNEDRDGQRLEE